MNAPAAVFTVSFAGLLAAHHLADYWLQTPAQARDKSAPGWPGRLACGRHVLTLTVTQLVAVVTLALVLAVDLRPAQLGAGLVVNSVSHWWADRRHTLGALVAVLDRRLIPGKSEFLTLGSPRPGHDDVPTLGTGAHALDQSWHVVWLTIAAAVIAAV